MNITDVFFTNAIALNHKDLSENKTPDLGDVFFPRHKKTGLDLKSIKTSTGLPVSLAPSNFDAKSTIRSRKGFSINKSEMAYFKESTIISEEDEQKIMRVSESSDPLAVEVLNTLFNDSEELIAGANVVPERMVWQLLTPETGSPKIYIGTDTANYEYNFDPEGTFASNNFSKKLGTAMWSQTETADPLEDVRSAIEAIANNSGEKISIMVINSVTLGYLRNNKKIESAILAQNQTANIYVTNAVIKRIFADNLDVEIIVYDKHYKDEAGVTHKYLQDDFVVLLPDHEVGGKWFGTTPAERSKLKNPNIDVSIVDTGVAVKVYETTNPDQTFVEASMITLPSFEGMDGVFTIKANTNIGNDLSGTVANGSGSGKTKVTLSSAGTGFSYVIKATTTAPIYGEDLSSWTAYTSASDFTITNGDKFIIAKVDNSNRAVQYGLFTAQTP